MSRGVATFTKAQQIEQYLREAIRRRKWAPGERLPTEYDLVSELRISRSTLREAMNSLFKDGLITRKPGQGTFLAEDVKAGTIAMVVNASSISSPIGYWARSIADEAKRQIETAGYRHMLLVAQGDTEEEKADSVDLFQGRASDIVGVLCLSYIEPLIPRLEAARIKWLHIGTLPLHQYSIILSMEELIEAGVKQFREHGYNEFAVMHVDASRAGPNSATKRAYDVMRRTLDKTGKFSSEMLVPVPWTLNFECAYDAFRQWWMRPNRPRAMFFMDDALCDVATRAMLELGVKVPDDLAIITQANVGRQFHFPVSLARLGWDSAEVTSAAWSLLDKLIHDYYVEQPKPRVPLVVSEGNSL